MCVCVQWGRTEVAVAAHKSSYSQGRLRCVAGTAAAAARTSLNSECKWSGSLASHFTARPGQDGRRSPSLPDGSRSCSSLCTGPDSHCGRPATIHKIWDRGRDIQSSHNQYVLFSFEWVSVSPYMLSNYIMVHFGHTCAANFSTHILHTRFVCWGQLFSLLF